MEGSIPLAETPDWIIVGTETGRTYATRREAWAAVWAESTRSDLFCVRTDAHQIEVQMPTGPHEVVRPAQVGFLTAGVSLRVAYSPRMRTWFVTGAPQPLHADEGAWMRGEDAPLT